MRKRPVTVAVAVPPADLLLPLVEVFVSPSEIALHSFDAGCRCAGLLDRVWSPGDCSMSLKLTAYRRWRKVRREWLATHGVTGVAERSRQWPQAAPRWRDGPPR